MGSPYCSGCGNLTIVYLWLPVLYYWLVALGICAAGLFKGRKWIENKWTSFVEPRIADHLARQAAEAHAKLMDEARVRGELMESLKKNHGGSPKKWEINL